MTDWDSAEEKRRACIQAVESLLASRPGVTAMERAAAVEREMEGCYGGEPMPNVKCKRHLPAPKTHAHPTPQPSCPWCIVERQTKELRALRAKPEATLPDSDGGPK